MYVFLFPGMAEQYNLHRYDGGRVRVGLRRGFTRPQTRAYSHLYRQRHRHRRVFLQSKLRAIHAVPIHQWCRVSYLFYPLLIQHL